MSNNYEIVSEEPISGSEVLDIINKKEKNKELTYRESRIKEHLSKFNKLSSKDFKEAKKELEVLNIPRIEDRHLIKILEILPKTGTELRAVTAHSGIVLVDESVKSILEILKKYS